VEAAPSLVLGSLFFNSSIAHDWYAVTRYGRMLPSGNPRGNGQRHSVACGSPLRRWTTAVCSAVSPVSLRPVACIARAMLAAGMIRLWWPTHRRPKMHVRTFTPRCCALLVILILWLSAAPPVRCRRAVSRCWGCAKTCSASQTCVSPWLRPSLPRYLIRHWLGSTRILGSILGCRSRAGGEEC